MTTPNLDFTDIDWEYSEPDEAEIADADPRTEEEIDLDVWRQDWYETYLSLRESMR